jgi:hypothetical protein
LGYNFAPELVNKIGLSKLRMYVQGQNLWTLTNYTGLDPEVNQDARNPQAAGSDFGTYPQTKSFSIGFNIGL